MKVQSGQSRSAQASSKYCLSPADRRERSVDSEGVGREDSAPKFFTFREPPESLARGTLTLGFSGNSRAGLWPRGLT